MFAVADQRRFAPWLVASALAHALAAALFVSLRALPSPPPAPSPLRVVRVDLVGAPAARPPAPAPVAAPPPAAPAPPPPRPVAARKPVATKPAAPRPISPEPVEAAPPSADTAVAGSGAAEGAASASVSAAPPAGSGAGSGTDAIAHYIASLQRAIDAHKSYPPMARRRGIEGVVTVRLAIGAQGGLERTALVGRPPEILARSTREAVDRASPFPPPPAGPLQIEFPVRYEIVE